MNKLTQLATVAALVTAAGVLPSLAHAQSVKIDGSSTVFPVTEAVAEEFQKANKQLKVTVGISGTGGGFKKFCRGETDIQNASRPILAGEMKDCRAAGVQYVELPVAYDSLTVVVHKDNPLNEISMDDLKKMWEPGAQGKVMRWNDANPAFPDLPLQLFGAGADSGTFDYFTEAVTGKSKSSRGDFTASEDDNVIVQGVSRAKNALGFFGFAYYEENKDKIKGLSISWKGGKAVAPSAANVLNGSYQPLSRPIFIYVNAKALAKPEIKAFADFYMKQAPKLVAEVKYVPLPAKAYEYNLTALQKGRVGTKMGGENKVGLTIEQLMTLEAKE
ncbi:PstS family phosphate ABC transporter substrate-binding protein [Sphaerotilus sp.]|uniref:PstS family phosphate ABC transporter substrate-binding protein n=1 Tax=Sphaerotilus sp. TaxID=2093942 RepID=UPI002ACD46AB|nr:PstS family phosphate ABC transporter substrate-binding protein [Sphaerotilus sp.]MDZ7855430.1 PstS family phosphate ABC transporter substrate-binding protein [Sphaerotilus sp.]